MWSRLVVYLHRKFGLHLTRPETIGVGNWKGFVLAGGALASNLELAEMVISAGGRLNAPANTKVFTVCSKKAQNKM
jgi:hypothetical protein